MKIEGRSLKIPTQERIIGWVGDNRVEVRTFELIRHYGDIDLAEFDFKLDTQVGDIKNMIDLDKAISGDKIVLTWLIKESHLTAPGHMSIQIRAFSAGEEKWHSAQGYVRVQPSINAASSIPDPLPSEFEQMEARVTVMRNEAVGAAGVATEQANRALGIADTFENETLPAAIQAVQDAGQEKVDEAAQQVDRVQGIIDEAEQEILPELRQAIEDGGLVKTALDGSIETAGTAKTQLDSSIASAGTAKTQLEGTITQASNAKGQVDDSVSQAGTVKTELEGSIATAGQVKEALDESIATGDLVAFRYDFESHLNDYATLEQDYATHKLDYVQQTTDIKSRFQLAHFDHVKQEYVNLDQFWNSLRNGKIYTVEFNQFDVSPSPTGVKKDDNEGLVCEPSTNTIKGRNDYEKIGLFMSVDVNAYVDENDDYHVTAIKGDGRFKSDGTMGDVYVMAMPGYIKRYADENVWGISYSDTMHPGFEILDEAVKPDGTIRPYLLHAKYVAGRNPHENNNLASISGVSPEHVGMSHNGQITEFKEKGVQYSGKTSHDDYYVQLMFWLKYATTHSQSIMYGCSSYYLQYENLVPETGVKRVITTNGQANNLLIGSCVSIGDYGDGTISADRNVAQNYNIANRVNIIDIVDLGDGNSAVYVDSPNAFNTTLTTTITTYPWTSGACDNVLGQDGSPTSNTSGKEPFIINGIEMMVGGYEVLQNLIIYNNNTDPDNYKIQVYACYDCRKYATSPTADYDLVGHELVQTDQAWKYISKIEIDPVHPTVMVPVEAEASSTTGFADGVYTNTPVTGYRAWPSLGYLSNGAYAGLRCLHAYSSLGGSYWYILGRLSATGRSRRRAGVN